MDAQAFKELEAEIRDIRELLEALKASITENDGVLEVWALEQIEKALHRALALVEGAQGHGHKQD